MTSTTIEVTHLEEIVGDHPICCDYADDEFNASDFLCSKEPAKWVLVLVRCATCHMGGARLACELAEQRVAGRDAPVGGGYADERLGKIRVRQPERAQKRAMRRPIKTLNRDARRQLLHIHARFRGCPCCGRSPAARRAPSASPWARHP